MRRPIPLCLCAARILLCSAATLHHEANEVLQHSPTPLFRKDALIQTDSKALRRGDFQATGLDETKNIFGTDGDASQGLAALQNLLGTRSDQKGTSQLKLAFVVTILGWSPKSTDYLEILRNSLIDVAKPGSQYKTGIAKFVALVPDHVADAAPCLKSLGFDEVVVTPATNLCPTVDSAWHTWLYTRMNLWNLTQYDRVVAMDYDQLVLQNIDELFEFSTFAAPNDWPRGSLGTVAYKYKCACKSKMCQGKVAGMQGSYEWIKEDHYLNTGLMLIQPDKEAFKKLAVGMMEWNLKRFRDVYDPDSCQPSEQRFVGDYFNVNKGGDGWFPLPAEIYNVRLLLVQGAPYLLTSPKILHYAGFKPTDHHSPSEPLEEWYWQQWLARQKRLVRTKLPNQCSKSSIEPARLAIEPAERMGLMSAEQKRNRTRKCGEPLFKSGAKP